MYSNRNFLTLTNLRFWLEIFLVSFNIFCSTPLIIRFRIMEADLLFMLRACGGLALLQFSIAGFVQKFLVCRAGKCNCVNCLLSQGLSVRAAETATTAPVYEDLE
jgi:hypothetical protein